jgi:hypothetical protein
MKFTNSVLAFSKTYGLKDLLEGFEDYYSHYKSEVMGKKSIFNDKISFAEKTQTLHGSIEEVVSKMSGVQNMGFSESVMRTNPNYQWAAFAVIGAMVDSVIADSVNDNFARFAEVKNVGFGDSLAFDIKPNDLFITTKAGNGKRHAFAQRQFNGQAVLLPENHMITVEEDLYRILAGKRNLAEYAVKVAMSVEEQMMTEVYDAINDTYSALPAQFKEASFTQTTFVQLAQRVKAFNGGSAVAAFGTQVALSSILPSNDYLKMGLGQEYNNNGYLGKFMGIVDLFELPQKADWKSATYATKLDDTRVYLISGSQDKLVKIGVEGETITYADNMTANATLTQRQTLHKKYAVGLISNAKYGIVDLG